MTAESKHDTKVNFVNYLNEILVELRRMGPTSGAGFGNLLPLELSTPQISHLTFYLLESVIICSKFQGMISCLFFFPVFSHAHLARHRGKETAKWVAGHKMRVSTRVTLTLIRFT
jgi:hypothetical protein